MERYGWKKGFPYKALDVVAVVGELDDIKEKFAGKLSPDDVIAQARHKSSSMHDYFEWDNAIAGEKWRVTQAQHLLRSIVIIEQDNAGENVEVRAFVVVEENEEDGRNFEPIRAVMADPDKHDLLLNKALAEITEWQRRYKVFKEFNEIFGAIKTITAKIRLQKINASPYKERQ